MVEFSVTGASRQSKYSIKLLDTGTSFLEITLNHVQLRMVCKGGKFLTRIHVKEGSSWSAKGILFRCWTGMIMVLVQYTFQIYTQRESRIKMQIK